MQRVEFNTGLAKFTPRQMEAVDRLRSGKVKFLLYGGAMGGGKSYFLRWYCVRRLLELFVEKGLSGAQVMLACEDYPSLKDRQLSKIGVEFPEWLGKSHSDHRDYGRCFILRPEYGSGVICFRNLDDPSKYQSAEFALIAVDELTKNEYDVFNFLRIRARWPGLPDNECFFIGASNPGGPGHGWVKQFWMDGIFPPEWTYPVDYRSMFAYVPSKAEDNPHLDAAYWTMLQTLPEGLRKAFRDGDWNVFVGQAFPELSEAVHAVPPSPIPPHAPIYMTFDWGFGKPFSVGWWWINNDDDAFRFAEWYGASGPDVGLRLTDSEIAEGIVEREVKMGLCSLSSPGDLSSGVWENPIMRLSGFDCFNKKPDYRGGGQGPTTAETFGKYGLHLSPMDSKRDVKIRQFRERLRHDPKTGHGPKLFVYRNYSLDTLAEGDKSHDVQSWHPYNCRDFFRTISGLVLDKNNIEDVDTTGEDHIYDEACHIVMARLTSMEVPDKPKTGPARIIEMVEQHRLDESDDLPIGIDPAVLADDDMYFGEPEEWWG